MTKEQKIELAITQLTILRDFLKDSGYTASALEVTKTIEELEK